MIDMSEIKIGSKVRIKGESEWYTVQDMSIQEIKTIHKGKIKFVRVYFGFDDHKPVWTADVEEVMNDNS